MWGILSILFGLVIFAFKAYVSWDSCGGREGMTPVLDGAIIPPALIGFGVCLCRDRAPDALWSGIGVGFVCAILFYVAIIWLGNRQTPYS